MRGGAVGHRRPATGAPPLQVAQPASSRCHETIHLHPTAELAERVLLPGDPGRALALAQLLLEKPLMFNHHRGLWGYTGWPPTASCSRSRAPAWAAPARRSCCTSWSHWARGARSGWAPAARWTARSRSASWWWRARRSPPTGRAERWGPASAWRPTRRSPQRSPACRRPGARAARSQTVVSTDLFYEPDPQREHAGARRGRWRSRWRRRRCSRWARAAGVPVGCVLVGHRPAAPRRRAAADRGARSSARRAEAMGAA